MNIEGLSRLSNEELLSSLAAVVGDGRRLLAKLLAYSGEVEARDLHLEAACSSLFDFCVHRLGLSEGEAFRRMTAARLARRFPVILEMVASGEIHLSALVLLRDHLTPENHLDLLAGAKKKTKREVQELLAARFPRPDAPTSIRALPDTNEAKGQTVLSMADASTNAAKGAPKMPWAADRGRASTEPLSATRYKLQVTISAELKDKLAHATNLMMHRNPTGDLEIVLGRAVELLIAELEKERFGKTKHPRKQSDATKKSTQPGYVTNAVRREVYERDGGQCTFVDELGRRCTARAFLEIDHIRERALGGSDDAENTRLFCAAHNKLRAKRTFGKAFVEKRIQERRSRRTPEDLSGPTRVRQPPEVSRTTSNTPPASPQVATSPQRTTMSENLKASLETTARAVKHLGFREREVCRALDVLEQRVMTTPECVASLETMIREALAVLT